VQCCVHSEHFINNEKSNEVCPSLKGSILGTIPKVSFNHEEIIQNTLQYTAEIFLFPKQNAESECGTSLAILKRVSVSVIGNQP
jgi:hypothetical protein